MRTGQPACQATIAAPMQPATIPTHPPANANAIASVRNCLRISRRCAPTAMRRRPNTRSPTRRRLPSDLWRWWRRRVACLPWPAEAEGDSTGGLTCLD